MSLKHFRLGAVLRVLQMIDKTDGLKAQLHEVCVHTCVLACVCRWMHERVPCCYSVHVCVLRCVGMGWGAVLYCK